MLTILVFPCVCMLLACALECTCISAPTCAYVDVSACSHVYVCKKVWVSCREDSQACALLEPHFPRGGHYHLGLFLLGIFCVPTSEFPKPLLWSMHHSQFLSPIITLKGTPASIYIYLRQVSRRGDSWSNVNMILRCWLQFPTSEITLSTLSFV